MTRRWSFLTVQIRRRVCVAGFGRWRFYGDIMSAACCSNTRKTDLNYRYIAVTQPIKYAKHKNNRRVWLTILLVWAISAAIGSPIVLGLNNTPDRIPDQCLFYNTDFIIYSSLSSFYIPCIIMVFLYYNIFKVRGSGTIRRPRIQRPYDPMSFPGSFKRTSSFKLKASHRALVRHCSRLAFRDEHFIVITLVSRQTRSPGS